MHFAEITPLRRVQRNRNGPVSLGRGPYHTLGKPTAALERRIEAQLGPVALAGLKAFESEFDTFAAQGREAYWLCRVKQSESRFANAVFEKALGLTATWRGINTLQRLAAKYPPPSSR